MPDLRPSHADPGRAGQSRPECRHGNPAISRPTALTSSRTGGLTHAHRKLTQLLELEERFRELATEKVAPRVARQLIRLQEQVGSPPKAGVEIGLSGEGLAQMTGTTEYTVSRLLSSWEAHGLVTCRRDSLVISDIRALRKVIEED